MSGLEVEMRSPPSAAIVMLGSTNTLAGTATRECAGWGPKLSCTPTSIRYASNVNSAGRPSGFYHHRRENPSMTTRGLSAMAETASKVLEGVFGEADSSPKQLRSS